MLPPRLLRRLVLAPVMVVVAVAVAVLFPLLTLLMFLLSLAGLKWPRRMRGLRVLCFAVTWLAADAAALFMSLGLWLASGFGGWLSTEPYQNRHYEIMHWFLEVVYRAAVRLFGLRVEVTGPECDPGEDAAGPARPVIVLSRHAGPGDSLLLVRYLLTVCQRRPRIVMTAALQLDPAVDVVANRVPNVFVRRRRTGNGQFVEQIERLARGLEGNGALVIFPEGANWTPGRWQRRIRRMEHTGHADLAARARTMPHLLPPRPGGALSAIAACPDADVIFVAHSGLDLLVSVGDVWRSLPLDHVVHASWWRVPAWDVPRQEDRETQVRWLYDWWQRIETWISDQDVATAGQDLCRGQGLALQRLRPGRPAAHRQRQVRGRAAQGGARAVRPVQVGSPQAAALDADAEVPVDIAAGQVIENDADGVVRGEARRAQRHGGVQAVNHRMVEGTVVAAAGRGPVPHHLRPQAGHEFAGRQASVPGSDLVRQPGEVELAPPEFGHELLLGIPCRHRHVGDHLADPPAVTQRRGIPLGLGGVCQQAGQARELGRHGGLQVRVVSHDHLP